MANRTETMVRAQRELLQAVSHELRTPLSRVQFGIDLVRDESDEAQREVRLDALERAANELDDLVAELLSYVRLETDEPRLEPSDIALFPVLEDLVERYALLFPSISFEIDEPMRDNSLTARADTSSLERAVGNLLANAGRFAQSRVLISARNTLQQTTINVDDDGPGIEAEHRDLVFDPFVRFDRQSHGTGLGLALVRRIVTNHGGSVAAMESPLGGCRICLVWPRQELANI